MTHSQDLKTRIALLALEELADRRRRRAGRAGRQGRARRASATSTATTPASTPAATPPPGYRLDPETAAASAGVRHAQMTRAILRGYDLTEPGPDPRRPAAGQHLPRLRQPGAGRRLQPQRPRPARRPGRGSWTPSTPCCATGRAHDATTPLTAIPLTAGLLRGALDLEPTARGLLPHRLPARARGQIADAQLAMAEAQPSGVRLAFRTRATVVELDVLPTKRPTPARRPAPTASTTCSSTASWPAQATATGGNALTIDMATGSAGTDAGTGRHRSGSTGLPATEQGRRDLAAAQRDHRAGRAAHRRPGRARADRGTAGSGCTTAARSATAPTPRARPRTWPARRRRRSAASTWSTWASAAARCSTRSPPGPCATRPPT